MCHNFSHNFSVYQSLLQLHVEMLQKTTWVDGRNISKKKVDDKDI